MPSSPRDRAGVRQPGSSGTGPEEQAREDRPLNLKREVSCYVGLKELRADKSVTLDTTAPGRFIHSRAQKGEESSFPPAVSSSP